MRVIGTAGKAGAGKSTVAGMLATQLVNQGYTSKLDAFGWPLYNAVRRSLGGGVIHKRLDRTLLQQEEDNLLAEDRRYLVKCMEIRNGNCFGMDSERPIPLLMPNWVVTTDYLIIGDVRRRDEAEFCRHFGILLFIHGRCGKLSKTAANHVSETGVTDLMAMADRILTSEPTLSRLRDSVRVLAMDIQKNWRPGFCPGVMGRLARRQSGRFRRDF